MDGTITAPVIEAYLYCAMKAYLKSQGQAGRPADYEALLTGSRALVGNEWLKRIGNAKDLTAATAARGVALSGPVLAAGSQFLAAAVVERGPLAVALDGLERADGASDVGPHHYLPVLFHGGERVFPEHRLLLAIYGTLLAGVQGRPPPHGIIYHGRDCRPARVSLGRRTADAGRVLAELTQLVQQPSPPKLMLNRHCDVCEFRGRCRRQAIDEDNMSLLRSLSAKEIGGYARKGIFTLTQLSYTFRPRRAGRRKRRGRLRHYPALKSLALRERRTYVLGSPDVPGGPVSIYFDAEGDPDRGGVYLLGLIVVAVDGAERAYSFWADGPDQEHRICEAFLAALAQYDSYRIYYYGSYEADLLRRMKRDPAWAAAVSRVEANATNVLSLIWQHVYFPVYSNGLKDVGGHLGCRWSEPDASGLQSVVWRRQWEADRDDAVKQKIVTYNLEDCAALKVVTLHLRHICARRPPGGSAPSGPAESDGVKWVEDMDKAAGGSPWGRVPFVHPDHDHINRAAYFDYQRERVYVRSSRTLRRNLNRARLRKSRAPRANRRAEVAATACRFCGGRALAKLPPLATREKRVLDLRISPSGMRRWVGEFWASEYVCGGCGRRFVPEEYERLARHGHGLTSWAMCEHVSHGTSGDKIHQMLRDYFGLKVARNEVIEFKALMATRYRPAYDQLLQKILGGGLMHADETQVRLKTGTAYVWVFTSLEEVVFVHRPTREGQFLAELAGGFRGVLVSDFYGPYNALACPQQKCLIHLIRDMNQDLLRNPFDGDLKDMTGRFGVLLRGIVDTADRHGLKRSHLARHQPAVGEFFAAVAGRACQSEAARALRDRLLKYRDKLFTLIRHDGVPWNNNNAENAIRQFVYYRARTESLLSAAGLNDYLVLLSLCNTCRYKGVGFLEFLLSRSSDVDEFCGRPRPGRHEPAIELYPPGFVPANLRRIRRKAAEPRPCDPTAGHTDPPPPSAELLS